MEPRVGAADVREDGSFDVPVPARGDSYALWLRPADALWPTELSLERALVGGATGELVLEPEPLSAFRIRVVALPPPVGPIPVQVTSYVPDVPNLVMALPQGESALKVEGREEGALYGVYVGPTSDGRCGFWQGRPRAEEEISVTLLVGGRLTGYIEAREQLTPGSLRVFMHALTGADVEAVVDSDGRFDQGGLSRASLWRVEARALTRSGRAVVSEAQVKPVDSEVVLRWGAAPR